MMRPFVGSTLIAVAIGVVIAWPAAANVLTNPGFEADAVSGAAPVAGATGWDIPAGGGSTTSDPMDPVHSGIGSLQLVAGGGFGVPVAFQAFSASPGDEWDLQGYMLTQDALPANATFGLLKIVFSDGASDLVPDSASVGQINSGANPGVESLPFLNSDSPTDTWVFTQARGVAPAGTTEVSLFAILVDESAATAYFDDLDGRLIPEPASAALVLVGLAGFAGLRRRRLAGV